MTDIPAKDFVPRALDALLALRAAGAFDPRETAPGSGVWRWAFRAAGWPVTVDLDGGVLCLRMVHDRDEVAMGRVPGKVMDALLGAAPPPPCSATAEEAMSALRALVSDWKEGNARLGIVPPVKVGHPDNWNRA
jgi:hypothetical protein